MTIVAAGLTEANSNAYEILNQTKPTIAFIGDSRTDGFKYRYEFDYGYADETSEIIAGDLNLKYTQTNGVIYAQIQEDASNPTPPAYGTAVEITGAGYFIVRAANTNAWLTLYMPHSSYESIVTLTNPDPIVLACTVTENATIGASGKRHNQWAEYFLSPAYNVVTTQGITGDTIESIEYRVDSLFTQDEYGNALAYTPDIVVFFAGTNDNTAWQSSPVNIKASIDRIVDYVTGRGAKLVFCTICTENPSAQDFQTWQEMNEYFRLKEAENGRVSVCDYASYLLDNTKTDGDAIASAISSVHELNRGANLEGYLLASHISQLLPVTKRSEVTYGGDYTNKIANGTMVGVGGTAGTGASGQIAASWTLGCSGSATVVGSIVTPTTGTKWQRMAGTFTAANEVITFSSTVATMTVGEFIYAGFEVSGDFNNILKEVRVTIDLDDGATNRYSVSSEDFDTDNVFLYMDNAVFYPVAKRIQVTADTTSITVSIKLISASAGAVTVDVRNAYAKYE